MAATNSPKTHSKEILRNLESLLGPSITMKADTSFYWSPKSLTIGYKKSSMDTDEGIWSLLHETSHAHLGHFDYKTDFELLLLEVDAWEQAQKIAKKLSITIEPDHIQDCLDTYRDWLHRRSTCPTCGNVGLQHNPSEYRCHNCTTIWKVTASRFCRPYRRKKQSASEKSPGSMKNQTTFR